MGSWVDSWASWPHPVWTWSPKGNLFTAFHQAMLSRSPWLKESDIGGATSYFSIYMHDGSHYALCWWVFLVFKQHNILVFLLVMYSQIILSNWIFCRYFQKIMDILSSLPFYTMYVQFPSGNTIPAKIQQNPKFFSRLLHSCQGKCKALF